MNNPRVLLVTSSCLLPIALLAVSCLKLKRPIEPTPEYMDTADKYEILDMDPITDPVATFMLEGKPFCFTGTNNYYLIYKSRRMVDDVLDKSKQLGLDVLRIWGFIDRGSLDESVPSVDDGGSERGSKDGVYFQFWDPVAKRPMVNTGENGLKRLDYVLHAARKRGLKLLVVLTNNWHEFGGMDQYLVWYGLKHHHEFYTNETVRQAFRNWIKTLVMRKNSIDGTLYRDDPVIFAWELANELRFRNNEEFDAIGGWDPDAMTHWVEEMSRYIKELDPNHLVAVGDEGFLLDDEQHWTHRGHQGVDHEALTSVETIDFATFHLYPDDWGTGVQFGYQWIEDHLAVARKLGKPTILEEYGTTVKRDRESFDISWGWERRKTAYTNWNTVMRQKGGNGMVFWMLAGVDDEYGISPDYDYYSVYKGKPTGELTKELAGRFKKDAPACELAKDLVSHLPRSPFVTVAGPDDFSSAKQDR